MNEKLDRTTMYEKPQPRSDSLLFTLKGIGAIAGAGLVLIAGGKVGEHFTKAVEINIGCTGDIELPVVSREPLADVVNRTASTIESHTKIRPTDTQIVNGIYSRNFGTYILSEKEISDLKAGLVPDGRSVLLVPERCPDPKQQS
jgi:hypothetical protein